MMKRGCTNPEVEKCLHCEKPECDCWSRAKQHISEIRALVYAGMIPIYAIESHLKQSGRKKEGARNGAR